VGVLLNNVLGRASIQTGASHQSMKIHEKAQTYISGAFSEVEECRAKDWATETNFYVSFYAFVVWQPSGEALDTITRTRPALAWAAA